ncbi:thioredoxin [Corynebacterium sp. 4HC-13]|uniref:Thioredoxin n=1 Tax=Corynebacterium anserum TaxID=2684406 RepID=A0A7G7YQL5_9CORY|nr:thioredoxin [Corynebacterium anserum]QNH96785.1 thioredoxin [Corynebacterium anserum]
MATVEITAQNFKETIEKEGITILDFWAEWCGPCQRFGPIFERASEQNPGVTFGKVDTEANQELAAALRIQSIPTIMFFRDGVLLERVSGLIGEGEIKDLVTKAEALDMDAVRTQIAEAQAQAQQQ